MSFRWGRVAKLLPLFAEGKRERTNMYRGLISQFVVREVRSHKLRYAKTLKGDWAGAFFGVFVGIGVGYLALASLGASSIDLADLTVFFFLHRGNCCGCSC